MPARALRSTPRKRRSSSPDAAPDDASRFLPEDPNLESLKRAAAACTACPLHLTGTQTVFGEGPQKAAMMLVGEQPGDYEDRAGQPFVGPAGKLLDRALDSAGIDRDHVYVTNAVKHFKWVSRGKKRIHSKPSTTEVAACAPWLRAEIEAVNPRVIVCLGATAAQALIGKQFRVSRERGTFVQSSLAPHVMATVHPSALLRLPPDADRDRELARFTDELRKAWSVVAK